MLHDGGVSTQHIPQLLPPPQSPAFSVPLGQVSFAQVPLIPSKSPVPVQVVLHDGGVSTQHIPQLLPPPQSPAFSVPLGHEVSFAQVPLIPSKSPVPVQVVLHDCGGGGGDGISIPAGGGGGELCSWHRDTPLSSVDKHSKNGKTEEQHSALLEHTSFNCLQVGRGIKVSGDGWGDGWGDGSSSGGGGGGGGGDGGGGGLSGRH